MNTTAPAASPIEALRALGKQLESETWEAYLEHPHHRALTSLKNAACALHVNLGWICLAPDDHPSAPLDAAWCLGQISVVARDLARLPRVLRPDADRWANRAAEAMNLLRDIATQKETPDA